MENLKYRAYRFGIKIIDLLESLPSSYIYQTIGKQVLRSGASIGANIVEAQAGRTRKDFTNYYQIALKSANETKFWLSILKEKCKEKSSTELAQSLLQEAIELSNILASSLLTLKKKKEL